MSKKNNKAAAIEMCSISLLFSSLRNGFLKCIKEGVCLYLESADLGKGMKVRFRFTAVLFGSVSHRFWGILYCRRV